MKILAMVSWIVICAFAALAPWLHRAERVEKQASAGVPEWPAQLRGVQLVEQPLGERDAAWSRDFPGSIRVAKAGSDLVIMRWVEKPTRRLHPATDCLRGLGYSTTPEPLVLHPDGSRWSCSRASRGGALVEVRERISDSAGNSWTDVSSWYWAALLQRTEGPWLSVTVLKRI